MTLVSSELATSLRLLRRTQQMSTKCGQGMTHVSSELAISLRFLEGHKQEGLKVVLCLAFRFKM